MAIFGLQVVTTQGGPIGAAASRGAHARACPQRRVLLVRVLGIIFQRERRALDDFLAGTAVVYSWDARAARLRWMARTESAPHGASPTSRITRTSRDRAGRAS